MAVMTLLEIVTCKRHRKQNKGTPMCLHNIESGKVIIKLFKLVQTKCCAMIISIIQVLLKILYKNVLRSTKFFTNSSTKQGQKERERERERKRKRDRERKRESNLLWHWTLSNREYILFFLVTFITQLIGKYKQLLAKLKV